MVNKWEIIYIAALLIGIFLVAFAMFGLTYMNTRENFDNQTQQREGCIYCLKNHGIKVNTSLNETLSPEMIGLCRNCEPIPWDDLVP